MEEKKVNSEISSASPFITREIWCGKNEKDIYGVCYLPGDYADEETRVAGDGEKSSKKYPLVIFCHELYRTHTSGISYAEEFSSHGIATYTFDFRYGSFESRSGNDMTKNSVMTEAQDLSEVLDDAAAWDFVDPEKIVVIGGSQGAFASAVTAERRPDDIAALVLMYGAFVIMDDAHGSYKKKEDVPPLFDYKGWSTMGAQYFTDVWDFVPEKEFGSYKKKILFLHGDDDPLVDPSYSIRVAACYPNTEFHIVKTGRHGFKKGAFTEAMKFIWPYLHEMGIC